MLKKRELRVFSHMEVSLSGRHLSLRLSGSYLPFWSSLPPSLSRLESGFNNRLDKACANTQEYLRLLQSRQDNAISSGKFSEINEHEWCRVGVSLRDPKAKTKSYWREIDCGYITKNHLLGESFGKNDTHC